jgi:hypothetical protein
MTLDAYMRDGRQYVRLPLPGPRIGTCQASVEIEVDRCGAVDCQQHDESVLSIFEHVSVRLVDGTVIE